MNTEPTEVELGRIRAPQGIRALIDSKEVLLLAKDIAEHGMKKPPYVQRETGELITGRARYAAHMILGADTIRVLYVDASDEEAIRLRLDEAGASERMAIVKELALEYARQEQERLDQGGEPPKKETGGIPKQPKRIGIERAAEVAGVHVRALERSFERDTSRGKEKRKKRVATKKKRVVINFGLDVNADYLIHLEKMQETSAAARKALSEAKRKVALLLKIVSPASKGGLQQLHGFIEAANSTLKDTEPHAICPSCKLIETLLPECRLCRGTGYVNATQYKSVFHELRDHKELYVEVDDAKGTPCLVPYENMFGDVPEYEEPDLSGVWVGDGHNPKGLR